MKIAGSIPDGVFAEADLVARRLSKSRSQLYAEAVAEYLARHDPDVVAEAMDRVIDQIESTPDEFNIQCAKKVLGSSEW